MFRLHLAVLLGLVVLTRGGPAAAETIYVSHNAMGPYGQNFYTGGTLGDWPSDYNGQMIITANQGNQMGGPTFTRSIWCIDQIGFIGLGDNPNSTNDSGIVYNVFGLDAFTSVRVPGGGLTPISVRQAHEIAAILTVGEQMLAASPSNVLANAIQAAITNIEYGTTSDGGPAVNQQTLDLMNWAAGLSDQQLALYRAWIYVPTTPADQMIISLVPEPSSMVLVGFGLGLLAVRRVVGGRRN